MFAFVITCFFLEAQHGKEWLSVEAPGTDPLQQEALLS